MMPHGSRPSEIQELTRFALVITCETQSLLFNPQLDSFVKVITLNMKKIALLVLLFVSNLANASELKIFGKEFCNQYDAGTCINFNFEKLRDARTFSGSFKYSKGRAAHDACMKKSDASDASIAICSMVFHRAEQTPDQKRKMCDGTTRNAYAQLVKTAYPLSLYDAVWGC